MRKITYLWVLKDFISSTEVKTAKERKNRKSQKGIGTWKLFSNISEPGFDPGTCGLWAHHASAAPL
jgi:hypothetical protein